MSATDWNELEGYEALVSELRANAPLAPESLRRRVFESAPAARLPKSRRRRLFLVVVPLAVVLAVGAAFVHGFISTGPRASVAGAPHAPALAAGKAVPGVTRSLGKPEHVAGKLSSKQSAYSAVRAAPAKSKEG